MFLSIGALLGFSAIAFGALIEHGLKTQVTLQQLDDLKIALHYHEMHAVVIVVLALFLISKPEFKQFLIVKLTQIGFSLGTIIFSFGIYADILLDAHAIVKIIPLGGLLLLASWLSLGIWAYQFFKINQTKLSHHQDPDA